MASRSRAVIISLCSGLAGMNLECYVQLWASPIWEGHGGTGACPQKGNKSGEGSGNKAVSGHRLDLMSKAFSNPSKFCDGLKPSLEQLQDETWASSSNGLAAQVPQLLHTAPKPILSVLQSLTSPSSLPRTGSPTPRHSSPDVPPWPVVPLAREQHEALQDLQTIPAALVELF